MGELMQQYIDEAEQDLLHTYNRYQVVLDRGDGVSLYDIEGKRYLDFVAGIAVFALGYHNAEYNDALKAQIDKVIHTSNYYYNVPAVEAARHLKKVSRMDRVFFTNSGAEAIEGAIKAARKYAYLKDGTTDHEIIAMNHSFHGRTMGALSVTGNPHYREAFEPGIGNIRFADLNDFDSVLACVNDKTCAILLETVQGEGGIYPVQEDFLKKVRALCDEKDILLILDEIQCGMGRTGYWYAWQKYGVKPDIMTTAKALGCGVPVGAFLMTEKVGQHSLTAGDHGTTYGGNPLACAAVAKVLELFEENNIGNIRFADLNDFDSVLACVNDKTCAILLETVQGEGGIYPVQEDFLKKVRALCDEKDILLILDEIQCGMGRTGYWYAWQKYGVKPDIMTTAKALGCGVPVGAFLMTEKVGQHSLTAGDHGTTYGGNPLACAAVAKVLELFEENNILEHVREVSAYLEEKLDSLAAKYDFITDRRGMGLMQGLVFDRPVAPVINAALENGLILINAGTNIIRFVPPLVITDADVDEMIEILNSCLKTFQEQNA